MESETLKTKEVPMQKLGTLQKKPGTAFSPLLGKKISQNHSSFLSTDIFSQVIPPDEKLM